MAKDDLHPIMKKWANKNPTKVPNQRIKIDLKEQQKELKSNKKNPKRLGRPPDMSWEDYMRELTLKSLKK